jgi:predicted ATPase/DNA-binding winged helix-turn-helix (wHTH) protein
MGDGTQAASGTSGADPGTGPIVTFGRIRLHTLQRWIEKDGAPVQISVRAFEILFALIEQAGTIVSKNDLIAKVWPGVDVDESNLRVHVAALRKALGDGEAGARYVSTVSGKGYCFVAQISRSDDAELPAITMVLEPDHNLPAYPHRMVGRDQAVKEIAARLRDTRFVTIVGPGGIGKTIVAISIGHHSLARFAGQVRFIDLGTIRDAALVPSMVAAALGLPARSRDPSDSLGAFLRDKRMLLILDCCEHVVEVSAALAERLCREAPQLHILATSRELLRVEGEHIHRLPPLASPPEHDGHTAESALTFPAVKLFAQRAAAVDGEFVLTDANASDVVDICRRLDGIALAIELAASRVSVYGLKPMIELLNKQLNLLWKGRRTAPARHRTLRATIEWSFNLLSKSERTILCRLSVFSGNFTLEAAQSVATTNEVDDTPMMVALAGLVSKSMLALSSGNRAVRYRLLDTTRAYALEKLATTADLDATTRRHARYFLHLLESFREGPGESLATILDQFGNIRAALTWSFSEKGDNAIGVALAAASMPLFIAQSLFAECQLWALHAIELLGGTLHTPQNDLDLHAAFGLSLLFTQGTTADAHASLTRALEIAERIGDVPSQLRLIERLQTYQLRVANFSEALALAKRGEQVAADHDDAIRLAQFEVLAGMSHHLLGETSLARARTESALMRWPRSAPTILDQVSFDFLSRAQITLARVLWLQGFPDQATWIASQAVTDAIRTGQPTKFSVSLLWAFSMFVWNSEPETFAEHIDMLIAEAARHSLGPYEAIGMGAKGVIHIAQGRTDAGISLVRESMKNIMPGTQYNYSAALAEALAGTGRRGEALETIDQAIIIVERDNGLFPLPELLRVKAEVLMSAKDPNCAIAERCLMDSLGLARRQAALAWELRTATSISKLWLRKGRTDNALGLLAPIYARFTEGFATRSLKAARGVLDAHDATSVNFYGPDQP